MKEVIVRIPTPTCREGVALAIRERYDGIYWNSLWDTKHYPTIGVMVVRRRQR